MCDTRHTGREGFTLLYRAVLWENVTSIRKGYGATYFYLMQRKNYIAVQKRECTGFFESAQHKLDISSMFNAI